MSGIVSQFVANVMIAGSAYSLVAIGFGLVYSTSRIIHIAHGAVYTLAAYCMYTLGTGPGLPWLLALLSSVAIAAGVGGLIELLLYRPLRTRRADGLIYIVASLGLLVCLQSTFALLFGSGSRSLDHPWGTGIVTVLGARVTQAQIAIVLTNALVLVLSGWVLGKCRIGLLVRSVANDPDLSRTVGIDTNGVLLVVFSAGSALAAGAAILIAQDSFIAPTMGFHAVLMGMVAAIVGGAGSLRGAVLGGFLVGAVQHATAWKLSTVWQEAVVFAVLVAFLLFRPQGFLGKPLKRATV